MEYALIMDWVRIDKASNGFLHISGPDDYYYSAPPFVDSTLMAKVLADHAKVEASGKEEESRTSERDPSDHPSSKGLQDSETQPFIIQGHGFPGGSMATDATGRLRILGVKDSAKVEAGFVHPPKEDASYDRMVNCIQQAVSAKTRGNFSEAERRFLDALDASRELQYDFEKEYDVLVELGILYSEADRFDTALTIYTLALEVSRKCFGKDSADSFTIVNALAVLYEGKARFEDAAALYRRSLAGWLKIGGPRHPTTLMTMQKLANIHQTLQRPQVALPLFENA
jgi:tetratricopeptide (TPR) repeat protein